VGYSAYPGWVFRCGTLYPPWVLRILAGQLAEVTLGLNFTPFIAGFFGAV
jgi:hypothetical protein